jgi:hypothetical protein
MKLEADARIPFDRVAVFRAYRDHLIDLLPFLPNVRGIEVKLRTDAGAVSRIVNVWHGGGEIPAAARAIVSDSMLSWTDHATWDESALTCEWRIETHAFTEAVQCGGCNTFRDDNGTTLLEIRGEIAIAAKKIKGVPGFMAGSIGRTVEQVLISKIQPNLVETARGLRSYLEKQRGT